MVLDNAHILPLDLVLFQRTLAMRQGFQSLAVVGRVVKPIPPDPHGMN